MTFCIKVKYISLNGELDIMRVNRENDVGNDQHC